MFSSKILVALCALCACSLPLMAQPVDSPGVVEAPQNDFAIDAGTRAGSLLLGMPGKSVLNLMGKPTELSQRSPGIEEVVWGKRDEAQVTVILASDTLIQVNVSDPKYKDILGNSTSSPLKTIWARYRAKGYKLPQRIDYGIDEPTGGGYEATFFDDVEAGLAYAIYTQDVWNESSPPNELIVHRAGKKVMPARGATLITAAQRNAQQAVMDNTEKPAKPAASLPRLDAAVGNGWPLTEVVLNDGARGSITSSVYLPGRVGIQVAAITNPPPGERMWHPIVFVYLSAIQNRPVWQDVRNVTFSWGSYNRLALGASKETKDESTDALKAFSTQLTIRFPYRDFIEMARAGKFYLQIGDASFAVERPQTVGLRALAVVCGGSDIELDGGTSKTASPAPSQRKATGAMREFFPQTSRRRLTRAEVADLSDADLRLAINEMYARHGLTFKDKELQAKFSALGWYKPREDRTYDVISARMSATERANIDLLAGERNRRNR